MHYITLVKTVENLELFMQKNGSLVQFPSPLVNLSEKIFTFRKKFDLEIFYVRLKLIYRTPSKKLDFLAISEKKTRKKVKFPRFQNTIYNFSKI